MRVTQEEIREALRAIGPHYLKPSYRDGWTFENPTFGYCYAVSEALYHYGNEDFTPCVMRVSNGTHWYLTSKDGHVLDLTGEQFAETFTHSGRGCGFFKGSIPTKRGHISRAGHAVAVALGFNNKGGEMNVHKATDCSFV